MCRYVIHDPGNMSPWLRLLLLLLCLLRLAPGCLIKQFSALEKTNAADKFSHCIGVRCKDGVVLGAVEMPPNTEFRRLNQPRKCFFKLGCDMVCAGITADMEFITRVARDVIQSYREDYGVEISGAMLADRLSSFLYDYNSQESVRPLGIAVIIVDDSGALHLLRSNSELRAYRACVSLSNPSKDMLSFLKDQQWNELLCDEAEKKIEAFYLENVDFGSEVTVRLQQLRRSVHV